MSTIKECTRGCLLKFDILGFIDNNENPKLNFKGMRPQKSVFIIPQTLYSVVNVSVFRL